MTTKQRVKLSNQVRRAVDASGLSRYRICKEIGLDQSTLSYFMHGKGGLAIATLDALADLLRLDIVASGKAAAVKGAKRPGRKTKAR
jgi:transcriptional regulator with XRE-family HTH domain